MNKPEFITLVANKMNSTKAEAEKALNGVFDALSEMLMQKQEYTHQGFGSFKSEFKAAHKSRNPKTGETITIAASKSPKFKAGKALKDKVKK